MSICLMKENNERNKKEGKKERNKRSKEGKQKSKIFRRARLSIKQKVHGKSK